MSDRSLQATVEIARRDYFPDWDIEGEWIFEEVRPLPEVLEDGNCLYPRWCGMCKYDEKTILIDKSLKGVNRLKTVIHEICHANRPLIWGWYTDGHGSGWQSSMKRAAKKAGDHNKALQAILLENCATHKLIGEKQIAEAVAKRQSAPYNPVEMTIEEMMGRGEPEEFEL